MQAVCTMRVLGLKDPSRPVPTGAGLRGCVLSIQKTDAHDYWLLTLIA
jgi:hypothetical protein